MSDTLDTILAGIQKPPEPPKEPEEQHETGKHHHTYSEEFLKEYGNKH